MRRRIGSLTGRAPSVVLPVVFHKAPSAPAGAYRWCRSPWQSNAVTQSTHSAKPPALPFASELAHTGCLDQRIIHLKYFGYVAADSEKQAVKLDTAKKFCECVAPNTALALSHGPMSSVVFDRMHQGSFPSRDAPGAACAGAGVCQNSAHARERMTRQPMLLVHGFVCL